MDRIDYQQLKSGEVNLGVCSLAINLFKYSELREFRPQSWLSNSTEESSLVQTVAQPQEATSYDSPF